MDSYVQRRLEVNNQVEINLSKNYQSLAVEVKGYENLMCVLKRIVETILLK